MENLEESQNLLDENTLFSSSQVDSQKSKRKSKNDSKGRDYICGCGRNYLSYPALYTHIKTKHGGINPEGTQAPQHARGRGRGRPPKNDLCTPPSKNPESEQKETEKRETGRKQLTKEEMLEMQIDRLKKLGFKKETEYDPLICLKVFKNALSKEKRQGYDELCRSFKQYHQLTEEEKKIFRATNCQEAFAEFLEFLACNATPIFFVKVMIYLKHYQDCLNLYGWELIQRYCDPSCQFLRPFTTKHTAYLVPCMSNDFIRLYLPRECPNFQIPLAIDITSLLCEWLHQNHYTTYKISHISQS